MIVLLILTVFHFAQAAINCPAKLPCLCIPGIIDCEGHNLYNVPNFSQPDSFFHTLKLGNNKIMNIPSNAFASLNVSTLLIDRNEIVTISSGAFSGASSSSIKNLNLAHNNLRTLPNSLSFLTKLQELDVSWNPISGYTPGAHHHPGKDGLTDSVMRELGDTLIKFTFGDSSLTSWPHSLDHLNQLQRLTVSGANITFLPAAAFHGFEQTLRSLTIEYAALGAIPIGIQSLQKLRELHLDNLHVKDRNGDFNFGDDTMISAPFSSPIAEQLEILTLKYDGLTIFPEVIKDLQALKNISLDGNDLEFVSDEAITLLKKSNVTTLSLKNCNLTRVPGAISDLKALRELDLSNNKIRSIESTDLQNLFSLRKLSLSENPLKYVSDNSLCGLNKLQEFSLYNTSLTVVAKSFKNLLKLERLDLQKSQIDCTCDMLWMKKWMDNCQDVHHVEIEGQCETIDKKIMEYINERLPKCPTDGTEVFTCGGICDSKK